MRLMKPEFLQRFREIKDLSETSDNLLQAIALVVQRVSQGIQRRCSRIAVSEVRGPRIVSTKEEFDDLLIPSDHPQRSPNKVLYLAADQLLCSHMTPMVARAFTLFREKNFDQAAFLMPGICYLRTLPAPGRVSEPHKLDVLLCQPRSPSDQLDSVIIRDLEIILNGIFQGKSWRYRSTPKVHPYTEFGLSVEVCVEDGPWIKVLECGLISTAILKKNEIDPRRHIVTVFGLGLERCVMVLKKVDDVRLLTYPHQRVQDQMFDLTLYREHVKYPSVSTEQCLPPISQKNLGEIFEQLRWEYPLLFSLICNISSFHDRKALSLTVEWQSPVKNISLEDTKEWTKIIASLAGDAWSEKWKIQ